MRSSNVGWKLCCSENWSKFTIDYWIVSNEQCTFVTQVVTLAGGMELCRKAKRRWKEVLLCLKISKAKCWQRDLKAEQTSRDGPITKNLIISADQLQKGNSQQCTQHSLKLLFIEIKNYVCIYFIPSTWKTEGGGEREIALICWFTSQTVASAKAGPGRSLIPLTPARAPIWMARALALKISSAVWDTSAGSCALNLHLDMESRHPNWKLNAVCLNICPQVNGCLGWKRREMGMERMCTLKWSFTYSEV